MISKVDLSDMDARIIECIAAGDRTTQIASKLYLSRQGIEYHVSKLLMRLGVPNRPALVARAYALGLIQTGSWPPRVSTELAA